MENKKQENINKAKKIWELFLRGESRKIISNTLEINRTEVSNVIKYTIPSMYGIASEGEEKVSQTEDEEQEHEGPENTESDICRTESL